MHYNSEHIGRDDGIHGVWRVNEHNGDMVIEQVISCLMVWKINSGVGESCGLREKVTNPFPPNTKNYCRVFIIRGG